MTRRTKPGLAARLVHATAPRLEREFPPGLVAALSAHKRYTRHAPILHRRFGWSLYVRLRNLSMTPRFAGVDQDVTPKVAALLTLLGIYVGMLTVVAVVPDGEDTFLLAAFAHLVYVIGGKVWGWYRERPVRVLVRAWS